MVVATRRSPAAAVPAARTELVHDPADEVATKKIVWTSTDSLSIVTTAGPTFGVIVGALATAWYPLQASVVAGVVLSATLVGLFPFTFAKDTVALIAKSSLPSLFSAVFFAITYIIPVYLIRRAVELEGAPSRYQILWAFFEAICIIGGCMSVCLHRYFAHQAFKTSRIGQVFVAIGGCLAYQGDPVWWATKHRRHHKHCDAPEDPHSWVQTNYLYAWIAWTLHPKEQAIDDEFIGQLKQYPELKVIGYLWWVPSLLVAMAWHHSYGLYSMVVHVSTPMLVSRLVTLLFNVEYHNPSQYTPGKESDPTRKGEVPCQSLDMARVLADCVGESCHSDHHAHPRRAKRPSGGFPYVDLPYMLIIKPLLLAGLVWSPADPYNP